MTTPGQGASCLVSKLSERLFSNVEGLPPKSCPHGLGGGDSGMLDLELDGGLLKPPSTTPRGPAGLRAVTSRLSSWVGLLGLGTVIWASRRASASATAAV